MRTLAIAATLYLAGTALAQSLEVYSEFRRVDPFGQVVSADRVGTPREILSPMISRNSHAGFHVVAAPPPGEWITIHIGQNPENAVTARLFRESFVRSGEEWVPTTLTEVKLPFQGRLPEHADVPGQKAFVFWLDVWVAPDARIGRIKLEPQMNFGDRWIIYPMEVRVMPTIAPAKIPAPVDYLLTDKRSDLGAMTRLRKWVCGNVDLAGTAAAPNSLAYVIDRGILQDMAIAQGFGDGPKRASLISDILRNAGAESSRAWCDSRQPPPSVDWYLRFRDALHRVP